MTSTEYTSTEVLLCAARQWLQDGSLPPGFRERNSPDETWFLGIANGHSAVLVQALGSDLLTALLSGEAVSDPGQFRRLLELIGVLRLAGAKPKLREIFRAELDRNSWMAVQALRCLKATGPHPDDADLYLVGLRSAEMSAVAYRGLVTLSPRYALTASPSGGLDVDADATGALPHVVTAELIDLILRHGIWSALDAVETLPAEGRISVTAGLRRSGFGAVIAPASFRICFGTVETAGVSSERPRAMVSTNVEALLRELSSDHDATIKELHLRLVAA